MNPYIEKLKAYLAQFPQERDNAAALKGLSPAVRSLYASAPMSVCRSFLRNIKARCESNAPL